MFFYIGKEAQNNYPCHWQLGNFVVSTDNGWQRVCTNDYQLIYKGYADLNCINDVLETIVFQTIPQFTGNFCVIVFTNGELKIQTDRYRSFPIYIDDHSVNNLISKSHVAWCDSLVNINEDMSVTETKYDAIGDVNDTETSVEEIDLLLTNKIQKFGQQVKSPIKMFLSGGVDTLLIYSYLKRLEIPHEIIWQLHCDLDWFYLTNHHDIQAHWGYTQIHHWNQPSILASGAPGDEFTLRSPNTANLYLMYQGTNILQMLQDDPKCFHQEYFKKYANLFAKQIIDYQVISNKLDLIKVLCNNVLNDWQHWHLGNTLTWTPLRDLDLFKLFLNLPKNLAHGQIMNSSVSCQLIEQNVPGLTKVLSDQKNHENYMKNIRQLLDNSL